MTQENNTNNQPWQDALAGNYDKNAVEYCESPITHALSEAARLAGDTRFTVDHRANEINGLFDNATWDVNSRVQAELERLAELEPTLREQAERQFSAAREDAALLSETRAELRAYLINGNIHEAQKLWEAALTKKDLITARVFYYHFAEFWRAAARTRRSAVDGVSVARNAPLPKWADELKARTDDALCNEYQRKARQALREAAATREKLQWVKNDAQRRLAKGYAIDRDGKFTHAQDKRIRQQAPRF